MTTMMIMIYINLNSYNTA